MTRRPPGRGQLQRELDAKVMQPRNRFEQQIREAIKQGDHRSKAPRGARNGKTTRK